MKVDLLELLRSKSIEHPTIITSLNLSESKLIVSLAGYAWWREERRSEEAPYEFHFENVSDGLIDAALGSRAYGVQNNEALEYFSVQPLKNVSWAQPETCQIFCSGAPKSSLLLYSKLEKYLETAEAFKQPKDFLNCGQSNSPVTKFAEITSETRFF